MPATFPRMRQAARMFDLMPDPQTVNLNVSLPDPAVCVQQILDYLYEHMNGATMVTLIVDACGIDYEVSGMSEITVALSAIHMLYLKESIQPVGALDNWAFSTMNSRQRWRLSPEKWIEIAERRSNE